MTRRVESRSKEEAGGAGDDAGRDAVGEADGVGDAGRGAVGEAGGTGDEAEGEAGE